MRRGFVYPGGSRETWAARLYAQAAGAAGAAGVEVPAGAPASHLPSFYRERMLPRGRVVSALAGFSEVVSRGVVTFGEPPVPHRIVLGGLDAAGEDAATVAARLVSQVSEVNDKLYSYAADTSWFQNQWQSAVSGQSFKDRVDQWHVNALAFQQAADDVVASNDPAKFDLWAHTGANILSNAQDYVNEMNDATFSARVGDFIKNIPSSAAIVWKGTTEALKKFVKGAGGVGTALTWEMLKPILIAGGAVSVLVLGLGFAMKKSGVSVRTPWVSVGGGDVHAAAVSAMNGLARRRHRARRRRHA